MTFYAVSIGLVIVGAIVGALIVWLVMHRQAEQARSAYEQGAAQAEALRDKVTALTADLAAEQADKRHLQEQLTKQMQEAEQMQQRLTTEFENIANRVLKQRQEDF